jgi:hypothetical protein
MSSEFRNTAALRRWIETLRQTPVPCDELTEERIWSENGTAIWQAKRFSGSPAFYPVYRWRDYYSYSPLTLVLQKGSLRLDPDVARRAAVPGWTYMSGAGTLDRDISRLGGPMAVNFEIRTPEGYASAIAAAVREDVARAEAAHPDFTNVILCGGKDSLNLLLLPWKNPVVAASAAPNHLPAKEFMAANGLKYDLIELMDNDTSLLPNEILLNFCRNDLQHCRWGPQLAQIARSFSGKLIFWKGQLGSTLMTPQWKNYTHIPNPGRGFVARVCDLFGGRGEYRINGWLEQAGVTQRRTFRLVWERGAMWQGAHMSLLRQLTGALVLSAYHGPAMRRVHEQVDLSHAVQDNVRPRVGKLLYGREVKYPTTNPGPPLSSIRSGVSHLKPFLDTLARAGIQVN